MATKSITEKRVFFSYAEATFNTPETTARFEGFGVFTPPKKEPQQELDRNKTGTGQHGTRAELQAIYATWSYVTERLSEIGYFWAMGLGRSYTASGTGPYKHEIYGQLASGRTLKTFTIEYGNGTSNEVYSGAMVNEINFTGSRDGNGVCKCTVTGFANSHKFLNSAITLHTAGTINSASEDFSAEPCVNFRAFKYWIGSGADDVSAATVSFNSENLTGSPTDLSKRINNFTIVWNNNLTAEELLRGGGYGVINLNERKDPSLTLEINANKDTALLDSESYILADTAAAFEFQFNGPYISGSDPYALVIIFPKTQLGNVTRSEDTPIQETIPVEVLEDTNGDAIEIYIQSSAAKEYHDTLA